MEKENKQLLSNQTRCHLERLKIETGSFLFHMGQDAKEKSVRLGQKTQTESAK